MPDFKTISFPSHSQDFFRTVNQRVNSYFKNAGINKHANRQMVLKTAFMFSLYFIPYFLILTGVLATDLEILLACIPMGLGIAGIGLSVMHDANHGAYSSKPWINNLLGYSLNVIGGSAMNWKVQHNVLHHTYTNIHDADEDISPRGILRMAPQSEWKSFHRYQHWYAWFFYGLMTVVWVLVKDFVRISHYNHEGLLKKQRTTLQKELAILILSKVLYVTYVFVVPVVFLSIIWWKVLLGVFIMHYIAGFILAIIFQPAHVIEGTEYPVPDEKGNMENNWAIHQLLTTTNFANKSRLFSWYVGGLNFQIEHHLFPTICHIHYKKIASIVQQTAEEFNLPYKSQPTFWKALVLHARLLKELGRKPNVAMAA